MWMAGGNSTEMEKLEQMPLIEYYALVDRKIDEWNQHKKNEEKKRGVQRTH